MRVGAFQVNGRTALLVVTLVGGSGCGRASASPGGAPGTQVISMPIDVATLLDSCGYLPFVTGNIDELCWSPHLYDSWRGQWLGGQSHFEGGRRVADIAFAGAGAISDASGIARILVHEAGHFAFWSDGGPFEGDAGEQYAQAVAADFVRVAARGEWR